MTTKEYQLAYREKNKEALKRKREEWRSNNASRVSEYNKQYYLEKTIEKRRNKNAEKNMGRDRSPSRDNDVQGDTGNQD